MKITILGNSSGGPFHGRHYTAQALQLDAHLFLIDCGEGTQMQIHQHKVKADRCKQLFITHLHGDHVFGLMGLITNWCLKKRETPLTLFSPPGLRELIETTIRVCGVKMTYPLEFVEVDASVSHLAFENNQLEVWTIPLNHRSPTSGWLFREKPKPLNIRPEAIAEFNLEGNIEAFKAAKAGKDVVLPDGAVIPNAAITLPPLSLRSYAFCSDTAPSEKVIETVRGVDLLYHEATFCDEHLEEAAISFHSTARQAAEVARAAGVGRLLLGHFSGRYTDETRHLAEAQEVFKETFVGTEGSDWLI
ncbi:MAG: ribonuclease Z [Saprospiraceae bacterium]|nr:ribonuclease Z [Saprospiraceae bacterium]